MSYAEAAKSSGPIGAEKIPSPPTLEKTTDPNGSVEVVPPEELAEVKKKARKYAEQGKKKAGELRKEFEELESEGKTYLDKLIKAVKKNYAEAVDYVSANFNTNTLVSAKEELKNPVVVSQVLVGLGGIAAGYFTYLERYRIKTDNKFVVATHAAIITGLVVLDGYLVKTYYNKYKKN